jgi:hypothetical protein
MIESHFFQSTLLTFHKKVFNLCSMDASQLELNESLKFFSEFMQLQIKNGKIV